MNEGAQEAGELRRRAREMLGSVGGLDGVAELLRRCLPRLVEPRGDADFEAAVADLADGLDEEAIRRLGALADELWLYRDAAVLPARPQPPPRPWPPGLPATGDMAPSLEEALRTAEWMSPRGLPFEIVVDVASYLAAGAIGGVVGGRADAGVVGLFTRVRDRWRARRASGDPAPLTEEEAVDLARAAARSQGHEEGHLSLTTAERREDGSWVVRLGTAAGTLRVLVPPGDPGSARIIIEPS